MDCADNLQLAVPYFILIIPPRPSGFITIVVFVKMNLRTNLFCWNKQSFKPLNGIIKTFIVWLRCFGGSYWWHTIKPFRMSNGNWKLVGIFFHFISYTNSRPSVNLWENFCLVRLNFHFPTHSLFMTFYSRFSFSPQQQINSLAYI